MAGFEHGAQHPKEVEDPVIAARNARYGLQLFVVYLVIYGGFVALNAFWPNVMEMTPVLGLNLAVLYGLATIVIAMVLSLVYCFLCRTPSSPPNET